jgi:hypothetical protein
MTVGDFGPGITAAAQPDPAPDARQNVPLNVTSPTSATAVVMINAQAATGPREFAVVRINTGTKPNERYSLPNAFTVTSARPSLPSGVGRTPPSDVTLLVSCPPPPSPYNDISIPSPYCVGQGQENVTVILTAVPPFQWPQGDYDPRQLSGKGISVTSAAWNSPTSLTVVMNVSATATLGPIHTFVAYAPPGEPCCTIFELGRLITVIPASSLGPTSPLLNPGSR